MSSHFDSHMARQAATERTENAPLRATAQPVAGTPGTDPAATKPRHHDHTGQSTSDRAFHHENTAPVAQHVPAHVGPSLFMAAPQERPEEQHPPELRNTKGDSVDLLHRTHGVNPLHDRIVDDARPPALHTMPVDAMQSPAAAPIGHVGEQQQQQQQQQQQHGNECRPDRPCAVCQQTPNARGMGTRGAPSMTTTTDDNGERGRERSEQQLSRDATGKPCTPGQSSTAAVHMSTADAPAVNKARATANRE